MKITQTALPGVLILTPEVYRDARGAFYETWNQRVFAEAGLGAEWVQDNYSYSVKNVIRGIHYQVIRPQAKLVRVTEGAVFDVAVDLRRSSAWFGKHVAVELSAENALMLFIPVGFGHAFAALTERAGFSYKVSDFYCREGERTIRWDDADLAIEWPVEPGRAIVSEKDGMGSALRDAEVFA